jgi:hypothetical protein
METRRRNKTRMMIFLHKLPETLRVYFALSEIQANKLLLIA